jgi:REP element-mobilizing transposase RayT
VPPGLKRYQQAGELHFITFSCYRRRALLGSPLARRTFQQTLERVRRWYDLGVFGYVVMPEHVHLLVSEPEHGGLAVAIQMLKQITAQKLSPTLSPKTGDKGGPGCGSGRVCSRVARLPKLEPASIERQVRRRRSPELVYTSATQ